MSMQPHVEALARIIAEHIGHDEPINPHSWRCMDKVRYPGPCGCDMDLAADITLAIRRRPDVRAAVIAALERHP